MNALPTMKRWARTARWIATFVQVGVAFYFFIFPGVLTVRNLLDPALRRPGIPAAAWRLHRDLVPRIARWSRERIASGVASRLPLHEVPSTEWPIFGSVFYLHATEALQTDWERQPAQSRGVAPVIYARTAIDACLRVLLDPAHHTWVRQHWGEDYLHDRNVFFRSLLIAGIGSYTRLTGDTQHVPMLRDQIVTLAGALDASPTGWLEDYPSECYPIDVLVAVAWMREYAPLAGVDIAEFVQRERRAFTGPRLDA
ncbi:MAG: hypothetical protein PHR35_19070, partial [Kiritimatiellae bacterium]|nr:hypothetical protein [Kiritimatiellia bacterium]